MPGLIAVPADDVWVWLGAVLDHMPDFVTSLASPHPRSSFYQHVLVLVGFVQVYIYISVLRHAYSVPLYDDLFAKIMLKELAELRR